MKNWLQMKIWLALIVFALPAAAQPLGAGVKVGLPLTDPFHIQPFPTFAAFSAKARSYTIGPYVEFRLPLKLALEADALYRGYDFSNASIGVSGRSWEFPVVVKHKLLAGPVRPYFEAGLSFQHLSDIPSIGVNHNSNCGIVAGGGLELRLGALKISPEIRYTGWTLRNFDSVVQSDRNQVTLLFGIGF